MDWSLTPELRDQIIFFMENQYESYVLDSVTGQICPVSDELGGERYWALPDWAPADGFRLMERFVDSLNNPVARDDLRRALSQRKGVFRQFKDTLHARPEVEKLWFHFKEREMRSRVMEWYEVNADAEALKEMTEDLGHVEDMVKEDFHIESDWRSYEESFRHWDDAAWTETSPELPLRVFRDRMFGDLFEVGESRIGLVALTASGDPAGGVVVALEGSHTYVLLLYVKPEYRGLGLGGWLWEELKKHNSRSLILPLWGGGQKMMGAMERRGGERIGDILKF